VKKPQLFELASFVDLVNIVPNAAKNQVKPRSLLLSSNEKEGRRQAILFLLRKMILEVDLDSEP